MNIFYLDNDLQKCAEYHVDKHTVKMLLEYSQLLCTAHWLNGSEAPYKMTHRNHPSAIWTRSSKSNYIWLCQLGLELSKEYTYRYEKRHKCQDVIEWAYSNVPNLPDSPWTQPTPAMPDQYKVENDSLTSYRNYYKSGKTHLFSWKKRSKPYWLLEVTV